MGKLFEQPRRVRHAKKKHQLSRLRGERRKLSARLVKLDQRIADLSPAGRAPKALDIATLDRWLDQLAEGLPDLPPLPADFSRADLYDDHD
jgi:hypothetical protein